MYKQTFTWKMPLLKVNSSTLTRIFLLLPLVTLNLGCDAEKLSGLFIGSKAPVQNGPKLEQATLTVKPIYTGNGNWLSYIKNDGSDIYTATNTACDGTESGSMDPCIHGGEKLEVSVSEISSCSNYEMRDELGLFDWVCLESGSSVRFVTKSLKAAKGLNDALSTTEFLDNKVIISQGGTDIVSSASAKWWSNAIKPLPIDGANIIILDNNDDDGPGGPDESYSEGDLLVATGGDKNSSGIVINMNRVAVIIKSGANLDKAIGVKPCANTGEYDPGNGWHTLICAGSQKFLWFEGSFSKNTNTERVIFLYDSPFSIFRNIQTQGSSWMGIGLQNTSYSKVYNHTSISDGIGINCNGSTSSWNYFKNITVNGASSGIETSYCDNSTYENLIITNSTDIGVNMTTTGSNNVSFKNLYIENSTNQGFLSEWDNGVSIDTAVIKDSGGVGVSFRNADSGRINNTAIVSSNDTGLYCDYDCDDFIVSDLRSINSLGHGVYFGDSSARNLLYSISVTNSGVDGVHFSNSSNYDNSITLAIIANNGNIGINNEGDRITLNHITTVNNGDSGSYMYGANLTTINNYVAMANVGRGIDFTSSVDFLVSNLALFENQNHEIEVGGVSDDGQFINFLGINTGSGGKSCEITATGTNPGLTDSTCALQGTSTAAFNSSINSGTSFVGKVTSDSENNSDSSGIAAYGSISDWRNFESPYRAWGFDGVGSIPSFTNSDACKAGNCRIYDWRLTSTDTALLDKSGDGVTSNEAFISNTACPSAVDGNKTITDKKSTPNTFLLNAIEILYDSIGDDDGLCESNEACIYAPNIGGYQGQGDYSTNGTCLFTNGTVSDVELYAYPINGI